VQRFWITSATRLIGVHGPRREWETGFDGPLRGFFFAARTRTLAA
jgi:hypothetical protein